ncbi:MAG: L,D-transpeptidase family protein [Desulfobacterales bacterium]|nr:L,D-transpeptidase family protein [Desulfobacterales bacterium]MDD4071620.1 L,D-transpeptidase family protein [Desulfobacterales bacterium]MDD4391620.1 L,D-transpeptidase family protein [Desulfobacterales bacterium]
MSSGTGAGYALIVDKKAQRLHLYGYNGQSYQQLEQFDCSTGKNPGPKIQSGDRKTPEGIYFFTERFNKKYLTPIYGTRAFPMDYPNSFDRFSKRRGYAIWMHGTNKALRPYNTNGCIALRNQDIDHLDRYIALKSTPVIIVDALEYLPAGSNDATKRAVIDFISRWNNALSACDLNTYLACYRSEDDDRMSWWEKWLESRKSSYGLSQMKTGMNQVSIFAYKQTFVVVFEQNLKCVGVTFPVGRKKMFLMQKTGGFEIVGEEYLSLVDDFPVPETGMPLITACRYLMERCNQGPMP